MNAQPRPRPTTPRARSAQALPEHAAERHEPTHAQLPAGTAYEAGPQLGWFGDLLGEALALGVTRIHAEFSGDACRLRLRHIDRLETRRIEQCDALLAILHSLHEHAQRTGTHRRHITLNLGPAQILLGIEILDTHDGCSWQLVLLSHPPVSPTLDGLIVEPTALRTLRAALRADHGLIVLAGEDEWQLAPLATAIAADCVTPDRKLVRLEAFARHPLPGAVQIAIDTLTPERASASCRAVLAHDADVIVADAVLPPGIDAMTDALAAHRLVVRVLPATPLARSLQLLRGDGADGCWLAEHLRCVVHVDQLRAVCPYCRLISAGAFALDPSTVALAPAQRLLAVSLQQHTEAPGCDRCAQSGVGHVERIVDVLPIDERIRAALREEDFDAATRVLQRSRRVPALARALARDGRISMAEAARLGAD